MSDLPGSEEAVADVAGLSNDLLLYDYFKHLTTLSLVTLGGVLGITDERVGADVLAIIVLLIGLGGGLALMGLHVIIRARLAGKPLPRQAYWYRTGSGGALSFGIGMFLTVFLRVIG